MLFLFIKSLRKKLLADTRNILCTITMVLLFHKSRPTIKPLRIQSKSTTHDKISTSLI